MAKAELRFGARAPDGRCSSVWFASRIGNDIYVGARSYGGWFKLSLHRDGSAQVTVTSRLRKHFKRWRMPEVPDRGAVHVASIVFPSRFLKRRPPLELRTPVRWEPAPEQGALEIGLFYGNRLATFAPGSTLRFATGLRDGRVVMVAVRSTDDDGAHLGPPIAPFRNVPAVGRTAKRTAGRGDVGHHCIPLERRS